MENKTVQEHHDETLCTYLQQHPHSLAILIGSMHGDDWTVLSTNEEAKRFFEESEGLDAASYFGPFWAPLRKQIGTMYSTQTSKNQIAYEIDEQAHLFESIIIRQASEHYQEMYVIELRSQEALLEEQMIRIEFEQKYMSVIEHNLDPIITINRCNRITYANISVHNAFGYRMKELSGRSVIDLLSDEKKEEFDHFIARAFAGESLEMEGISFFHKKGKYVTSYIKAIPVKINGSIDEIHLILRDTSYHQKNNEKLLFLSYHDQLTGLWNRRALKEHFKVDADYAKKSDEYLSFIHLDLDRFKTINDSLGRNGADEMLKMIADRIKMVCRKDCKLYRNGGDEYIISFRNHSIDSTESLVQRILSDFTKPFYYNHQEYFISASVGISVYPHDGVSLEGLLQKAEQAVLYVKENGRSHYRFYREDMNSTFTDLALMESHLRRAIEFNELAVYYQPQVNLNTGQIDSFEALLRWNNRKFGFVSPMEFIPLAEESGLIHTIGDWVLEVVCKQLKEWQDKQYRPVRIAVNISPKQFRSGDFALKTKELIEKHEIDASSFEVEITETALMHMNDTLLTLQKLKAIGVTISVDDFGTGYSSLSYLKQYPIDIIKIDRSFIKDIEHDKKNEAIAKTIINLAHNLGMEVIAEGVEKELQAKILKAAACHKAQGFLFSKPVPASQIVDQYFDWI